MFIKCNNLVLRQTRTSQFSHWEGAPNMQAGMSDLEDLVSAHWPQREVGFREGVWLVPVPTAGFYSGIASLLDVRSTVAHDKSTVLTGASVTFDARRAGEMMHAAITVRGPKLPAKQVNIVVYSHDVLGSDATTQAEHEIISINALPFVGRDILQPVTMMRNHRGLEGGTKAIYTADQFAESILFWSQNAMVEAGSYHEEFGYSMNSRFGKPESGTPDWNFGCSCGAWRSKDCRCGGEPDPRR